MDRQQTLHFVGGSSRSRAEQAHLGFDLGYHCEVHADADELLALAPDSGVVFAYDGDGEGGGAAKVISRLAASGRWMPVVATACEPRARVVVRAIKAGALDFMQLPLNSDRLVSTIDRIAAEAQAHENARRKMVEARSRIASLSPREREVLDWLAEGRSNKMIARELHISPRTVEIHRANMMHKLGAAHPAQAVRVQIEAHLGQMPRVSPGRLSAARAGQRQ